MITLEKGTIYLEDLAFRYADKATIKRSKSVNERNTLGGTLNTSAFTTGGTIALESLIIPETVQEATRLEEILNAPVISFVKVVGTARTKSGKPYTRTVTGINASCNTDEEEWNAEDGIIAKLDFNVDVIQKVSR